MSVFGSFMFRSKTFLNHIFQESGQFCFNSFEKDELYCFFECWPSFFGDWEFHLKKLLLTEKKLKKIFQLLKNKQKKMETFGVVVKSWPKKASSLLLFFQVRIEFFDITRRATSIIKEFSVPRTKDLLDRQKRTRYLLTNGGSFTFMKIVDFYKLVKIVLSKFPFSFHSSFFRKCIAKDAKRIQGKQLQLQSWEQ